MNNIIITSENADVVDTIVFNRDYNYSIHYDTDFKLNLTEGDLAYEYSAFMNLQDEDGKLKPFRTKVLDFDLQHPVEIDIQPSYDGTVNLILNDDKNPPRLINSRFTVTENKTFKIIDRFGDNDTNIYKEKYLDINTRLFKTTNTIAKTSFLGLSEGGQVRCGNYTYYFKYADADGNETDFIAETGMISVYIGNINKPKSIRSGIANEFTNKIIKIRLENLDLSYEYINVYYTRSSSDFNGNPITDSYKLKNSKDLKASTIDFIITGLEEEEEININELNLEYNIVNKVKTQAQVQNMLFMANVDKPTIDYKDLEDLSLRIYPTLRTDNNIGLLDEDYNPIVQDDLSDKVGFYDASNCYNFTGYWNKEIYRFGIVYIMKDDSLSPVFNVRGRDGLSYIPLMGTDTFESYISKCYTYKSLFKDLNKKERNYITYDSDGFLNKNNKSIPLENSNGVVRISLNNIDKGVYRNNGLYPISICFNMENEVIERLKKHVKGYFFVRQKRIPTILAQGISVGIDNLSHVPMAYVKTNNNENKRYITESFINKSKDLVHDFDSRIVEGNSPNTFGLLCPDALFKSYHFNEIFTGANFNLSLAGVNTRSNGNYFSQSLINNRYFYLKEYNNIFSEELLNNIKLTSIEDGMPIRYSGTKYFSSRAGIPEEPYKFEFLNKEDRKSSAVNLIRGYYTGYVGAEGIKSPCEVYDIHVSGYNLSNMEQYFILRGDSFHPFYSISNRFDINKLSKEIIGYDEVIDLNPKTDVNNNTTSIGYGFNCYRGDCYMGNITMRMQRNFQDPDVPTNDAILDSSTWKNHYKGYKSNGSLDKEELNKINRADVNAVRIAHWVTFFISSNVNICYRSIDERNTNEYALTGHYRSFYPLSTLNDRGTNKISDSYVSNTGFNTNVSYKNYFKLPEVPAIKSIFSNRVMYSEPFITDAFKNGYRIFQGMNYEDITTQYGSINKIFEFQGSLIIVFENGVGKLSVNERALVNSEGGDIFIDNSNVIQNKIFALSTNYGCSWQEGVVATANFVYGIDTEAKKIWRTNGESFEIISDFKVQKFLNDNIVLSESDKYIDVLNKNVKIHYNAYKDDIIFVFYKDLFSNEDIPNKSKYFWSLTFNEQLGLFVSFNSWKPLTSDNINNIFFSTDLELLKKHYKYQVNKKDYLLNVLNGLILNELNPDKKIELLSIKDDVTNNYRTNKDITLMEFKYSNYIVDSFDEFYFYKHGRAGIIDDLKDLKPCFWYDKQHAFEFEFIVNAEIGIHKMFENLIIISNNAEPESLLFTIVGDSYKTSTLNLKDDKYSSEIIYLNEPIYKTISSKNEIQLFQKCLNIWDSKYGRRLGNIEYVEDFWRIVIKSLRFNIGKDSKDNNVYQNARIRDKFCKIRIRYSGEKEAVLTGLKTLYTQSFS